MNNCPLCGEYDKEKEFCCPGCGSTPDAPHKNIVLPALDRLCNAAIKGGDAALAKADYWIVRGALNA